MFYDKVIWPTFKERLALSDKKITLRCRCGKYKKAIPVVDGAIDQNLGRLLCPECPDFTDKLCTRPAKTWTDLYLVELKALAELKNDT